MASKCLEVLPPRKKSRVKVSRYSFMEVVGQGSYSRIWRATDNATKKTVAIKEICKRDTSRKELYKELKYSQALRGHTHIGTTHGLLCKTRSCYYMVQDFAWGGDLCTWIASRDQRPEEKILKLYF